MLKTTTSSSKYVSQYAWPLARKVGGCYVSRDDIHTPASEVSYTGGPCLANSAQPIAMFHYSHSEELENAAQSHVGTASTAFRVAGILVSSPAAMVATPYYSFLE